MLETREAGAGSYPDFVEGREYKCYEFEVEVSAKVRGYVYAKELEEARECVGRGEYEEIEKPYEVKIENVCEVREASEV